ncbi:MAG: response regulator [Synechocystis sp.]|nr:response regulator [Synechocystis sp.]
MQGTLNEIDLRSILQLIELGQRTGELFVEVSPRQGSGQGVAEAEFNDGGGLPHQASCWFLFFVNGKLAYAADQNCAQLRRLQAYLHHYGLAIPLADIKLDSLALNNIPEYACLWQLLSKNILTPTQAHRIIRSMIEEVLFDLLSLRHGNFVFELGSALEPPLTTFAISPLLSQVAQQLQAWKQLYLHVQSPDQRVAIATEPALAAKVPEKLAQRFREWTETDISLRQIARYLQKNVPTVAHGLYPYIEQGGLHLSVPLAPHLRTAPGDSWETLTDSSRPHIVCLDDDLTVGKQVELFLSRQGYQVTLLQDPLEAMTALFTLRPDLILCDITMPTLDGYEICRVLKHSQTLRLTPIIMLTGKDAYLDRLLARMAGANDYLTKPFGETELLSLIEPYCRKL